MSRLERAAAWAGIGAGIIALASLMLQILRPDVTIIQEIEQQFPFYIFFLFILAIVALTFFLVSRMVDRIGDMNVTLQGDVITTNRIGDYLEQNFDGMTTEDVSKIIDVVAGGQTNTRQDYLRALDRQARINLAKELAMMDPQAIIEAREVLRKEYD